MNISSQLFVYFRYPNNWRLNVTDVDKSDAGLYICQISSFPPKVLVKHLQVDGKCIENDIYCTVHVAVMNKDVKLHYIGILYNIHFKIFEVVFQLSIRILSNFPKALIEL